jgi:hypothetical protein
LSSHVATAIQTPPWFGGIVSTKIGQVNLNTPEKGKKKLYNWRKVWRSSRQCHLSTIFQEPSSCAVFLHDFPGYANRQNLVTHGSCIQQYSPWTYNKSLSTH